MRGSITIMRSLGGGWGSKLELIGLAGKLGDFLW